MAEQSNKLIGARYTGHHAVRLPQRLLFNVDGSRRTKSILESGEELLMPEREILGFTLLHDPHMVQDPLDLGPGKRVLPEHAGLDAEQLANLGYEFHGGRTDFEPLEVESSIEPSAPADETPAQEAPVDSAQESAQPETPPAAQDPLTVLSNLSSGG